MDRVTRIPRVGHKTDRLQKGRQFMKLKKLATVAILAGLLAALAACGGGSPISPTPTPACPTGVNVTLSVKYVRQQSVNANDPSSPTLFYRVYGGGPYVNVDNQSKIDYYTWTTSIVLPENAHHDGPHQVHEGDSALLPNSAITATDIYVNGTLVAKTNDADNNQLGWFRVDGCSVVTATAN